MTLLDKITEKVLAQIDDTGFTQSGAFNLRHNGIALCHGDSEHIKIKKKQDKPGIDIFIDGKTDGEEVHIPVVVDASGMTDVVYNDFYVAEGANVTIVAGCGYLGIYFHMIGLALCRQGDGATQQQEGCNKLAVCWIEFSHDRGFVFFVFRNRRW